MKTELIEKLKDLLHGIKTHEEVNVVVAIEYINEAIQALEKQESEQVSDAVEFYKFLDSYNFIHLAHCTYYIKGENEEKYYSIEEVYQYFKNQKSK